MTIPRVVTSVLCGLVLFASSLPSIAAPVFELEVDSNYGRFVFGDWGYWFEVGIGGIEGRLIVNGTPLDFEHDFHATYTGNSDSLLSVGERTVDFDGTRTELVHEYTFGSGRVDLTFDYLLYGVREYGSFTGTIGSFRTDVFEGIEEIGVIANISYGSAPVVSGVLDARTAELFGLPQRLGGGEMEFFFDNERLLLGHYGDAVREAAAYGAGPNLSVSVPEPGVSTLLLVAGATLAGRRFGRSRRI